MVTGSRCFYFTIECAERPKDVTDEQRKHFGGSKQGDNIIALSLNCVV